LHFDDAAGATCFGQLQPFPYRPSLTAHKHSPASLVSYADNSTPTMPATTTLYIAVTDTYHIEKNDFKLPFVCGAKNLGEALRRIQEGASMIRTKGAAGTSQFLLRHSFCCRFVI
jgi:hypothetical protein